MSSANVVSLLGICRADRHRTAELTLPRAFGRTRVDLLEDQKNSRILVPGNLELEVIQEAVQ